ncbi:MAG TPA: tRNA pseudouridine(13) synthase TruD [Thermoplasmata archaeon]|nr:tRNA pseudouridine(13) synthase TruD [Thermoplasmata archaeon]
MTRTSPCPPPQDRAFGLEFYATSTPGVVGRTKSSPDAFRVTEISNYPLPDPSGAYSVLRIQSRDWEQHELGQAIARRLGLPVASVQWAGTKDRRAVAERLVSYRGPLPGGELGLPRVSVLEAYTARDGLVLGHHFGNAFEIRVDGLSIPAASALDAFRATERELRDLGHWPNFFGPQRFGEVRPVTHEVGRHLVRGDIAAAVETYLVARPPGTADGVGDEARANYARTHDAATALREFPTHYRFERALLERLEKGDPPERAFRALGRELRLLFVHAYQALLFNRWLSRRWAAGVPLDQPVPGDRLLRIGRDGTVRSQEGIPVGSDNLSECTELVRRGGAWVAGPLLGYETPGIEGTAGELLENLLQEEQIERGMFRVPAAPEVASKGAWRPAVLPVPPIGLSATEAGVWFRFALPKGAYATVLLREFLKSGSDGPEDSASKGGY